MTVIDSIRSKLKRLPRGEPFTSHQFSKLGSSAAVRKHLSGLTKQGVIHRVARGIYILEKDGARPISPEKIAIAVAKAGKYRVRLIWTDRLRESVFITEGPPKRIHVRDHRILMRHVSPHAFDRVSSGPSLSAAD